MLGSSSKLQSFPHMMGKKYISNVNYNLQGPKEVTLNSKLNDNVLK